MISVANEKLNIVFRLQTTALFFTKPMPFKIPETEEHKILTTVMY
jgi:hypothetical protein